MELFDLLAARRSVRQYTEQPVSRQDLEKIVKAGLMAPSSKNLHSTEFLVVEDRGILKAMAHCKPRFGQMLEQAPAAIVVMGRVESHAWVEDASVAMMAMMLQTAELGLGSCWVQVRHMTAEEKGRTVSVLHPISIWHVCWICRKEWKWRPSWPWAMRSRNSGPGPWRKPARNGFIGAGCERTQDKKAEMVSMLSVVEKLISGIREFPEWHPGRHW